jgi:hypothetical protein
VPAIASRTIPHCAGERIDCVPESSGVSLCQRTGWDVLLLVALNLVFWIAASFLKPYLGRKGENLATHEDPMSMCHCYRCCTG